MNKIKNIGLVLLAIAILIILMYLGFQSDFAHATKSSSADAYKLKRKNAKKLYYNTDFKRYSDNSNLVSLGNFTVNMNGRMLTMKVTLESDEDTIDLLMDNQSVIRDDVINSIYKINGKAITQENIQKAVQATLNSRFPSQNIKDIYFESFIVQ